MTKVNAPCAEQGRAQREPAVRARTNQWGASKPTVQRQLPPAEEPSLFIVCAFYRIGFRVYGHNGQQSATVLYAPGTTHWECTIVTSDVRRVQRVRIWRAPPQTPRAERAKAEVRPACKQNRELSRRVPRHSVLSRSAN